MGRGDACPIYPGNATRIGFSPTPVVSPSRPSASSETTFTPACTRSSLTCSRHADLFPPPASAANQPAGGDAAWCLVYSPGMPPFSSQTNVVQASTTGTPPFATWEDAGCPARTPPPRPGPSRVAWSNSPCSTRHCPGGPVKVGCGASAYLESRAAMTAGRLAVTSTQSPPEPKVDLCHTARDRSISPRGPLS